MKKQITNFTTYENQLLDFSLETPTLISSDLDNYLEEFNDLRKQFELLRESYPSILDDDIINTNYQQLLNYIEQNNFTLANCYNFYNKEYDDNSSYTEYGIRIVPSNKLSYIRNITITGYHFFHNNQLDTKSQLNLKSREGIVENYNMIIDDFDKCILDKESLDFLEQKVYKKRD